MIPMPTPCSTNVGERSRLALLCCILTSLQVGCNSSVSTTASATTSAAKPKGEIVDNVEFLCWNRFPVDTRVIRKREISSPEGRVEVVTTLTLRTKSDTKITVDQQVTVKRPENTLVNEPQSLDYVAKFELPQNMSIESFSLPSLKAKKTGSEPIEVLGKTYNADVFEWVEMNEGGPMNVKLWRCDEIPGRTAKEESLVKEGTGRFLETVSEIDIPSAK